MRTGLLAALAGVTLGVAASLVGGAVVGGAVDAQSGTPPTGKYHFKTFEPLELDVSQVAVQGRNVMALRQAAAMAGLGAVREFTLPGWWMIDVPGGMNIREAVTKLAAMPEVDFATPVFLGLPLGPDQLRLPTFPNPEVFVGFLEGMTPAQRGAAMVGVAAIAKGELLERDWGVMAGVDRIRAATKNGFEVLEAANAMAVRADVRFAEPDMVFGGMNAYTPNDPFYPGQWTLNNANDMDMNLPEAWDITQGSAAVVTMVLDTGVQMNHPDLNLWGGADFTGSPALAGNPGNACDRHGTPVAGCIAGRTNNGLGIAGVAGGTRVASARIGIAIIPCDGRWNGNNGWTVDAINWAATNGFRVTNNSNSYGVVSAAIDTAYTNTRANNAMVHFASNGNSGAASIAYPASSPSVNGVMAINSDGDRAGFSQYGTGTDFAGPGVGITSTDQTGTAGYINGDYVDVSGTSFASPNTAAVAALVISRNPALSASQVEFALAFTAKDRGVAGYDTVFGHGIPDAWRAIRGALTRPANDDCSAAANVSAGGTFTGSLVNATFSTGDGAATCGIPSDSPDVWYTFTAPAYAGGQLRVTTCGTHDTGGVDAGIDTVLSIFDGCGGMSLACNDDWTSTAVLSCSRTDAGASRDSAVAVSVMAGQTVKIRVSRYGGQAAGAFTLNVFFTPVNDACSGAIDVSAGGAFLGSLDNATFTPGEGEATCGNIATAADVWYAFTAPDFPVRLRITTCGTHDRGGVDAGIDTVVAVFNGCGASMLACNDDYPLACGNADVGAWRDSVVTLPVAAGGTVSIRVSRYDGQAGGMFALHVVASPLNDACVDAVDISSVANSGSGTFISTLTNAASEGSIDVCGASGGSTDVWWKFTAPVDCGRGRLRVTTCGTNDLGAVDQGVDSVLSIHEACGGPALTCNDDWGTATVAGCAGVDQGFPLDSAAGIAVEPGETVFIRVARYAGAGVAARVVLNAFYGPANDLCSQAITVESGTHDICTTLADTDGPTEMTCFFYPLDAWHDVWFRYDATCTGTLPIETCESGFDTVLMVYPGVECPLLSGTPIGCDDDSCPSFPGLRSQLAVPVIEGNSYLIRVGGYSFGAAGFIRLNIGDPCPPCLGDFNQDGGVDGSDVVDFFTAWENGDAAADLNQDGGVDGSDIGTFYAAWESGC